MEASGALHVHEIAIGRLDQSLELVAVLLLGSGGVKEILGHIICAD